MLIVPVENRPDWKNPPLATLLLILINVLVFFVYQSRDQQRMDQSFEWYVESGLLEREHQPFLDYLHSAQGPMSHQVAGQRVVQFQHAAHDPAFARALHQNLDSDAQWYAKRSHFETLVRASSRAYAFSAMDARPVTWITNMFLHSGVMHLLGNMVFLFLFGFALEIAIGRGMFLLLYLGSGLGGTLLFWASELGNDQSIVARRALSPA